MSYSKTLQTRRDKRVMRIVDPETKCAQDHFKDECDVNRIIERYQATGVLTHVQNNQARYGEMPSGEAFQSMMTQIAEARSLFEELPSKARQHFNHDPVQFLNYIQDDPSLDILDDLGLTDQTRRDARLKAHWEASQPDPVQPAAEPPSQETGQPGAEAPAG